ncbi:MAG TPA: O-antigen ligase family protein [Gemmatimonadaceae bacterium]|nr:O-antigen ligase family protein [Gemmatimonadaceae bacterium]
MAPDATRAVRVDRVIAARRAYPPLAVAGVLAVAAVVGVAGAIRPELFAVVLAALASAALGVVAHRWPERAMRASAFAIALGETKFRLRDPSATLSSAVDGQVAFELGLSAIVGVLTLGAALSPRVRLGAPTLVERVLIVYATVAVASVAWSFAPAVTAVRGVQLVILLLFAATALRALGDTGFLDAIAGSVLLYVLLFSVIALVVPGANGSEVSWHGFWRFSWYSVHPIQSGVYAGAALLLMLAAALFGSGAAGAAARVRYAGVPAWVYAVPLAAVLAATRSRGPLLAVVVAAAVLVARRVGRRWMAPAVAGVAALGALAMAMAGLGAADVVARGATSTNPVLTLLYRGQDMGELATFSGRLDLWRDVVRFFLDRPFLGYGYQGSRALLLEVVPWAAYSHNAVAETLLNVGVVGSLPLLFALVSALFAGSRAAGRVGAAAVGMAVFLLVNSLTSESFAAAPGLEAMLLFASALLAERCRARRAGEARVAAVAPVAVSPRFAIRAVGHARTARS